MDVGSLLGVVAVVLSATPLLIALYMVWGCIVAGTRVRFGINQKFLRKGIAVASVCAFAVMMGIEIRYWQTPSFPIPSGGQFYVVGDSISIGADAQELNWPERLADNLGVTAHTHSFGGAKVRTALPNAKRIPDEDAFVILEIGGNDVLAGTDTVEFSRDLEALLKVVCTPNHDVVMFELPLPPFHNAYGRIQRKLAQTYEVTLIPKRLFAQVLASKDATLDGLHLSHEGHELMAARVAEVFTQSR